jgi:hypothetical protein
MAGMEEYACPWRITRSGSSIDKPLSNSFALLIFDYGPRLSELSRVPANFPYSSLLSPTVTEIFGNPLTKWRIL